MRGPGAVARWTHIPGKMCIRDRYHTPHGTVPFDRIETEHYEPAILEGIKLQNAEIEAIIPVSYTHLIKKTKRTVRC